MFSFVRSIVFCYCLYLHKKKDCWTRKKNEKKEDDYVVLDDTPKDDVPAIPHDMQQ